MKLKNIIEFRDWLFDFTAKMTNDHILGEQEILYMVKDKFSSLGLNDNKIDKEPINENELEELVLQKYPYSYYDADNKRQREAYKAGYRKAIEE